MPKVYAVIETKQENVHEFLSIFREKLLFYVMENYDKGRDLAFLIRNLENMDIFSNEPTAQISTSTSTSVVQPSASALQKYGT